jgi:glutamyl-Q tRNA(Asp) synthetase
MITRFAPSPTGPLHLGHAYSAILAHDMARAAGGKFLLRIEDIDATRSRPEWEEQIYDDLAWLGLSWDGPVLRQSDRIDTYRSALRTLWKLGLLFACSCNRRDIRAASSAPQEGVDLTYGPDGLIYPGTCKAKHAVDTPFPDGDVLRLNSGAVSDLFGRDTKMTFEETGDDHPKNKPVFFQEFTSTIGDIVLSRKDFPGSYHLTVVLDDAHQHITHVIRGADLADATPIHVLLQLLLDLPTPVYHHHHLIRDDAGKRLAKRDDARAIATYRRDGATPTDIRQMVGLNPLSLAP